MRRFHDKFALITGGSSGIGLATARRLLAEGAAVVVTGRDQARLDAAVRELDAGDRVFAVPGDAAEPADLDTLADAVEDRYGRLDVVFANAGAASFRPIGETSATELGRLLDVNVKGVFFTIQKLLPLVPDHGAIVINASWTLHRGMPGAAAYSASKAAAHNLAPALAAELGPRGIRVNSVSAGYIETPMFHAELTAEQKAEVVHGIVAGRLGTPEDVAAAVAYLASADASYVNGQDLIVDGGLVASVPS